MSTNTHTTVNTLGNTVASASDISNISNEDNTMTTVNSMNELIPGTNLTWAEGSAMAKDYARDQRADKIRSRRTRRVTVKPAATVADIEAAAGWGEGSLVDFIAENQREERLFGRASLYN